MAGATSALLQPFESQVATGKLTTFTVYIGATGLLVRCPGTEKATELTLTPELLHSIQTFFYGQETINYGSFDYATLNSLLNAHACLDRMAQKPHETDRE